MSEAPSTESTATGARFPCRECGAKLEFAPGTTSLRCPYCSAENQIAAPQEQVRELDFHQQLKSLSESQEIVEISTLKCDACAAEIKPPPNLTATDCPFCGFHLNITTQMHRLIKPRSLLPFAIDRARAQDSFFKWLKSLWFAPGHLKSTAQSESRLNGTYIPYWTYDADTRSAYTGQRGDDYTVTVGTGKNRRQVRRTRWRSASGMVREEFDDVLILASNSLPPKITHSLEPWDLGALVPYANEYLAGFQAECYQVDLPEGFGRAKAIMDEKIRELIRHDIGGDHQRIDSVQTEYNNLTFKHILLPVWISAYRFHGKVYRFLVNARTGEVQGERPWSAWKITLAILGGLLLVSAIVLVVMASR